MSRIFSLLAQKISDRRIDFNSRLFFIIASSGVVCLCLMSAVTFIVTEGRAKSAGFLVMSAIVLFVILSLCFRTGRTRLGMIVMSLYLTFLLVPFEFFHEGAIQGGTPVWILLITSMLWVGLSGRVRTVILLLLFGVISVCYEVAYFYPRLVIKMSHEGAVFDSYIAVIIAGVILCSMFWFQRHVYEEERRVAEERRVEVENNDRSRSLFFSAMSHEIRTPINAIIGFNELTMRACDDIDVERAERREGCRADIISNSMNIRDASRMLLSLINDILDISKMQVGKMEILPVEYMTAALLTDVISMMSVRAREKGLSFRVSADPAVPRALFGDDVRVKQMIVNLLSNAVKYTDAGSVTFSVSSRPANRGVEMIFEVTDTGKGIRQEDIPNLFSAFRRVDEGRNRGIEGTGLGLSITRTLAGLMGGEVSVDSIYTKGSTFRIVVPQEVVDAGPMGAIEDFREASRGRERSLFRAPGARILVVDDNEMNRRVVQGLLAHTGMNIDLADSGEMCLEKTLESSYHAILMDHVMTGMDGVETLKAVRAQEGGMCRDAPVIALTAASESAGDTFIRAGFDGYIPKPVNPAALETSVKRILPPDLVRPATYDDTGDDEELERSGVILTDDRDLRRKKRRLMITTEMVADISVEAAAERGIALLPAYVCLTDGTRFLDGVEINPSALEEYLADPSVSVVIRPPERSDYVDFFAEQLTKADRVIHISFSSADNTIDTSAVRGAVETFSRVDLVDSGSVSAGMGVLAMYAAEMARGGASRDEVLAGIEALKGRIDFSFMIGDTRLLTAAGRMGRITNAIFEALMMHPVCTFRDGRLRMKQVMVGRFTTARLDYVRRVLSASDVSDELLVVVWSGLSEGELSEIMTTARAAREFRSVVVQRSGAAVYSNCGAGSLGLLYLKREAQ